MQAELEKRKYEKIKERYLANKKANSGPKRSPTVFFLFAKDRRPALQAQPEAKVTDVAKILGEEWRNLADNSKLKYQQEAHRLKKIYEQIRQSLKRDKTSEFSCVSCVLAKWV